MEIKANYTDFNKTNKIKLPIMNNLVPFQEKGTKLPIFIVHPVNGQVHWYREIAKHLGNSRPIYGIEAVGLRNNEPLLNTIEDMAICYIKNILANNLSAPYILAGWSFGCEVAFEMTVQLINKGYQIPLLILLDPQTLTSDKKQLYNGILGTIVNEYGISLNLSETIEDVADIHSIPDIMFRELNKNKEIISKEDRDYLLKCFQMYNNNINAMSVYKKTGSVEQIFIVRAQKPSSESALLISKPATLTEWQPFCKTTIEEITLPGNHYSILTEQNAKYLALHINKILNTLF